MPYCVKQDIGTWLSGGEVTISKKKRAEARLLVMLFSVDVFFIRASKYYSLF